tara:strand:+ start:189 stop:491 length:303 start_codon:yes stop_codon:yes gene_type:complete
VYALKVLLIPDLAKDYEAEMLWEFSNGEKAGLLVRNQVAVPTNGEDASVGIALNHETWAKLLGRKITLSDALSSNILSTNVDISQVLSFFAMFDHESLNQ